MSNRQKLKLSTGPSGLPRLPEEIPTDPESLLDLMDDAARIAGSAQGSTAPAFDHGIRVFNQLHAHYQLRIALQMAEAHHGLERATLALKVATWWLGVITAGLGALELWKIFGSH